MLSYLLCQRSLQAPTCDLVKPRVVDDTNSRDTHDSSAHDGCEIYLGSEGGQRQLFSGFGVLGA
jgi:hypothetical protein